MTKEEKELKEKRALEFKALTLVVDYYKYFMNLNDAKRVVYIQNGCVWSYSWTQGTGHKRYLTDEPHRIWITTYKTSEKKKNAESLKQLLILSPDMHCEYNLNYGCLDVKWINLELPSIKNNSLGFERKV